MTHVFRVDFASSELIFTPKGVNRVLPEGPGLPEVLSLPGIPRAPGGRDRGPKKGAGWIQPAWLFPSPAEMP